MNAELIGKQNFSTARNNFKTVFDTVAIQQRPLIVHRHRDEVFLISRRLQKELLAGIGLSAEVLPEENGSVTIAVDALEIAVNGGNREEAIQELLAELKRYAADYMERIQLFVNAPNRRAHLPFVLRIILADNDDEILQMVNWIDAAAV